MFQTDPDDGLTPEQRRAYEAYLLEVEAEDEARRKAGGLSLCPECGQRAVRERVFPTRQYGGGYDTTYACENPLCDYAEVCV